MDPQVKAFLDQLASDNPPGWETMSPAEGRAMFASFEQIFGPGEPVDAVEDRRVDDVVPIRIYRPSARGNLPVVVYFHGGGWVLGGIDTHDSLCRRLCNRSGCVVVSVGYRCAPEHMYPVPLDDCYQAVMYVVEHAGAIGIDTQRLAVAGDSAGGNLAAAVALRARDRNGPAIRFQLLIYPVIDQACDSESYSLFAEGFGLTRTAMRWFWQQYVGSPVAGDVADASLSQRADLAGLPAAHVVTAEYDVLRDEGEAFAAQLSAAGVPTTSKRYEGVIHGFIHFLGMFDRGREAVDELAQLLQTTLNWDSP